MRIRHASTRTLTTWKSVRTSASRWRRTSALTATTNRRCRSQRRLYGLSFRKQDSVTRKPEMSKQAMRDETERLVKEALERKTLTVKQGKTRIDSKCRKCGALNRVSADQGQVRVPYKCKECGEEQRTF